MRGAHASVFTANATSHNERQVCQPGGGGASVWALRSWRVFRGWVRPCKVPRVTQQCSHHTPRHMCALAWAAAHLGC